MKPLLRSATILLFTTLSIFAQQPAAITRSLPTPPADAGKPETTHAITLDVVVTNKAGRPVPGLKQEDLVLLDNKRAATITSFRAVDSTAAPKNPVTLILLIDEINTPFQGVAFERDSVKKYLARDEGHLARPVTLMFLSDDGADVFENISGNGNDLAKAFQQHETKLRTIRRSQGFYGAADRFGLSLTNLNGIAAREQDKPGRKILVWISPGWPYLSGPNVILTTHEEQSLFHSIVFTEAALRRARITMSSVNPIGAGENILRANYYEEFLKGVSKPSGVEAADLSLQVIAAQTGGRVLNGSNDNEGEIAKAASDADAYYVVTIDTPPAEHADEYHALQVKVEQSGLTARTRTGYYAQP